MDKDEMKNKISMALKEPILQQGFEIICKENAQWEQRNETLKDALEHARKIYGDALEKSYKEIAELKAYNRKLLQSDIDKQNKIVLLSKKVNDLQKENVGLKDYRLTIVAKQQTDMSKYALNLEHKLSWYDNKLNKAKVIINKWLRVYNTNTTKEVIKESEDFLKED